MSGERVASLLCLALGCLLPVGGDVPATIAMHVAAAPLLLYIYISE